MSAKGSFLDREHSTFPLTAKSYFHVHKSRSRKRAGWMDSLQA